MVTYRSNDEKVPMVRDRVQSFASSGANRADRTEGKAV